MYFYTQFSYETRQRFSAANENDNNIIHNDIYIDLLRKFYEKYELPSFHHDQDGFSMGDAIEDDMLEVIQKINELHGTDEPAIPNVLDDYLVDADDEKNHEYDFSEVLSVLDKKFMAIEEAAYDAAFNELEN